MAILSRSAKKLTAVSLYLTFVFAFTITMRKIRVAEIDTRLVLRFHHQKLLYYLQSLQVLPYVLNLLCDQNLKTDLLGAQCLSLKS